MTLTKPVEAEGRIDQSAIVAVSQAMAFEESAALGGIFTAVVRLPAAKTLAYFKRLKAVS